MKRWITVLFCAGALAANATVYRTIDGEGADASIDTNDWCLYDNGYSFVAVTKGEPDAPWLSPSQHVGPSGHSIGYRIRPTTPGAYTNDNGDPHTTDKINHSVIKGNVEGGLTFGKTNYYMSFYVNLGSNNTFQIPSDNFILVQWWQGTAGNPPLSLQILPNTPTNKPPQFAFFCKDDETGAGPSETKRMIFQGEMPIGEWQHFIVKIKPNYIGNPSGEKAEIKVWHNGKLLNSLVNYGSAYTGYCGYKPTSSNGIPEANDAFGTFIGIYRARQMKLTQVFFDNVQVSDTYELPTGIDPVDPEEERYSLGTCGISVEMENSSSVTPPMVRASDTNASAGTYLWVTNGSPNGGKATYYLEIPTNDYYYLWMRATATNAAENSYFAAFNTNAFTICDLDIDVPWRWNVAGPFYLNAGINTLTISNREDGAKLDCFHIGTDYQPPPVEKSEVLIEAENGKVTSPMKVKSDYYASAGRYVVTTNGTGNGITNALVEWSFHLEEAATAYVWGLIHAPTGADNSFNIKKSGAGSFATWNVSTNSLFTWEKYGTAFNFSAGSNSVIIGDREDGTEIDKVYIGTGNPTNFFQ